jgi:lysophospholipase L1-like esterase
MRVSAHRAGHGLAARTAAVLVIGFAVALGMAVPIASAETSRFTPVPKLVVLGDSFASGEGNAPYQPGTDTSANRCHRSDAAYGPLLAGAGLVALQAFRACSGATTQNLLAGQYNEGPQIDHIVGDTDVVTVQALGNDIGFGRLAGLCIIDVCDGDNPLVKQALTAIETLGPALLDNLYTQIRARVGSDGKVIAVPYANPFPAPSRNVGPNCEYMMSSELTTAQAIANGLNRQIKAAAQRHGFRYAELGPLFLGRDVCSNRTAFYSVNPNTPQTAWLHPNTTGQRLYAVAVGVRLFV